MWPEKPARSYSSRLAWPTIFPRTGRRFKADDRPPSLTRFWTFPESLAGNGRGYRCVLIGQQVANVHRVESRLQLFQHDGRIAGGNGVLVSLFGGLLFYHY